MRGQNEEQNRIRKRQTKKTDDNNLQQRREKIKKVKSNEKQWIQK